MESESISWLLETDDPGVRYLAMRDLLDYPEKDANLVEACKAAHAHGPIATVLDAMDEQGFWVAPGPGYDPKYRSTVWAIILLAELGARVSEDERLSRACAYLLEHALNVNGQFSVTGTASGTADCLQGNLCWAIGELGYEDPRIVKAFDWMARTVTGEGIAPLENKGAEIRYYAGKCGPTFACGANNKLPCAWGGAKVMLAFSRLPESRRTPTIQKAIDQGVEFFFSVDPTTAAYPSGWSAKPSSNWWKPGFPVFYVTDLLQVVEALVGLGFGKDPRLANALQMIRSKQDDQGRWLLEYDYAGKTWVDFGKKKQPNKWVSLRALRILHKVE